MGRRKDLLDQIGDKILVGDGCWEWTGCRDRRGYGALGVDGKRQFAHRVMYELMVGPIPEGLVLDHAVCQNPSCVRPSHLEPVTQQENLRRGKGGPRSHCSQGHPMSGANLYVSPKGERHCNACMRARNDRYRAEGRPATRCRPIAERTGKPRGLPPATPLPPGS